MTEHSKIEWCDHTFNPWMGCTKVSPGCKYCYAETMMDKRYGKVVWGPEGTRIRTAEKYWRQPFKWNKQKWWQCTVCGARWNEADGTGCAHNAIDDYDNAIQTRQRVFCASLADVFEDNPQVANWRGELFQLIDQTPNLDWLILTKRTDRIFSLGTDAVGEIFDNWLMRHENVWLGTSVENQKRARERIPELQKICAHVRFLSCEPLLDHIDLSEAVEPDNFAWDEVNADWDDDDEPEEFVEECEAELDWVNFGNDLVYNPEHREWAQRRRARAGSKTLKHGAIDWVICGGESGPNARPMHPAWAQALRDECQAAGIPFFFKQWGECALADALQITEQSTFKHKPIELGGTRMYRVGKAMAGRLLDGKEWSQFPNVE
jgi:protein gp37